MIEKQLLRPELLRRVPERFSWLAHRLVRDNRLRPCDPEAAALYLFLVCVCDAQGLSYYGDKTVGQHLNLAPQSLALARRQLIQADLIAHRKPLYQVLDLSPEPQAQAPRGGCLSLKELFQRALEQEGAEK
ncbi:MAG: hypothetical protein ACI8V5_003176 [Limisphaerales bacterium]|jgi:hypothetical protein